jgi:AraC-like DNA-binding protein
MTAAPSWLAEYVLGFVVDESADPVKARCVPGGRVIATVDIGDAKRLLTAVEQPTSPVAGLHDRPQLVEFTGQRSAVGVILAPWGAHSLFGVGMHALANEHVGMADLVGPTAVELAERMADLTTWPERIEMLAKTLWTWFEDGPRADREVVAAWRWLRAGEMTVESVAREVGWSRRRLESRFRDQVGLPPKKIARIFRFHRAVDLLATGERAGDVAVRCGYWDQAHLNRDFRVLAGRTPTELMARHKAGHAPG